MASAELSRRVGKVVGYPPLSDLDDLQRREFHEAMLEAGCFEDLPGKWQAAILEAEQNRPKPAAYQQRLGVAKCHGGRHEITVGARRWGRRAWLRWGACAVSAQSGGARRTDRRASCLSAWARCSTWSFRTTGR